MCGRVGLSNPCLSFKPCFCCTALSSSKKWAVGVKKKEKEEEEEEEEEE